MIAFVTISLLFLQSTNAFTGTFRVATNFKSTSAIAAIELEDIEDFGYYTACQKPLGAIFEANPDPYSGLKVGKIEVDSQGASGGLRIGDQLLAVNGLVVIGDNFDSCMGVLQASPSKMELLMYRGNVRDLYNIMNKRDLQAGDDDGSEAVIMDENYESPVRIEFVEESSSEGIDVGKVFSKLMGGDGKKKEKSSPAPAPRKEEQKKSGGLFGMFGENIQLEGEDASGTGS